MKRIAVTHAIIVALGETEHSLVVKKTSRTVEAGIAATYKDRMAIARAHDKKLAEIQALDRQIKAAVEEEKAALAEQMSTLQDEFAELRQQVQAGTEGVAAARLKDMFVNDASAFLDECDYYGISSIEALAAIQEAIEEAKAKK